MQQHFESIEVMRMPVEAIKAPLFVPALKALIEEILTAHGAALTVVPEIVRDGRLIQAGHALIAFPQGTYRCELLPRTHDEKYRLIFPDGYALLEVCQRGSHYSFLQFDTFAGLTPDQIARLEHAQYH